MNLSIHQLFEGMRLVAANDSDSSALFWLEQHQKTFYGFLDGCWLNKEKIENDVKSRMECYRICDTFNGTQLCDVYAATDNNLLELAAKSSAEGFKTWSSLCATSRSKILHNVAQTIEKYQNLFSTVEAVSTAKHLYKVKKDIPNFIESFNYFAGCALKMNEESMTKTWFPTGPVCVMAEKYNNPSLTLSLRVSSVLASGNSVLLLTDVHSSLSSFLLAEICSESGIPAGVLNVLPVDEDKFKTLGESPIFSKLIYTGTFGKSVLFSKLCAEAKLSCDFLIPRRPVVIVYENADLYSAVNGVIEAFLYHDTRGKSGGCKVMIQESIHEKFLEILKERFMKIKIGNNLSKTDMSALVTDELTKFLKPLIQDAIKQDAEQTYVMFKAKNYSSRCPTLLTNLQTSHKLVHEECGGPLAFTIHFRTVKESISMFNCDNKGSPVSVWTERSSIALEVASKLKSGVIWINSENVMDTRTAFTGVYQSGNSFEGGEDTFYHHMSLVPESARMNKANVPPQSVNSITSFFTKLQESSHAINIKAVKDYRNVCKSYIGGIQKGSDNAILLNEDTLISLEKESGIQSAISSAASAHPKWEALPDLQKRKILIDIMERLRKHKEEYATELQQNSKTLDACHAEIEETLAVLYYWIMQSDKYSGTSQKIKENLMVLQNRNPLGVIGIQCPDDRPLLSFVSLVIPAIVHGNTVVAIASAKYPTLAFKLCEIFTSAMLPGGVINVVWGNACHLVPALKKHPDVNAVWYTDVPNEVVHSNPNVTQHLYCCNGMWSGINEAKRLKFAIESTFMKSIFLPFGEVFAN